MSDFITVYEGNESKILKISDDLYFRVGSLEKRDQCNTGIVVLKNSVALIDYPAQNPCHEIIDEAESITGLPVRYIILTHPHTDHVDGIKTLKRNNISLIARKSAVEYLFHKGYFPPEIFCAFDETCDFELDGRVISFIIPPYTAHSPWDMMIGIKEHSVLFTGDLLALPKNMFLHTADLEGWTISVEEVAASQWKYIARGHGTMIEREAVPETVAYLKLLNEARLWQMRHHEYISVETVENPEKYLSSELADIVCKLKLVSDVRNVTRQINQAHYQYMCSLNNS